jgi:hypothetical protein
MIHLLSSLPFAVLLSSSLLWSEGAGQMLGDYGKHHQLRARQNGNGNGDNNDNGNNGQPDTSAFNIVNGRIFTPGLGIILAVSVFFGCAKTRGGSMADDRSPNPLHLWAETSST